MGINQVKQLHELEAEYGMKIALRHWTKLKEYREYTDYSLQMSLSHWADVGDLIRVQQILKEVRKRAEKAAESQVQDAEMNPDQKISDEDRAKIKSQAALVLYENLCRIPFQIGIRASRLEILDEFFKLGLSAYPSEYMHPFVEHPMFYCRSVLTIEYLEQKCGVSIYDSPLSGCLHAVEFQKVLKQFAGDGLGDQPLLVHLLQRNALIAPETAMELLSSALQLITRTFYSNYLEKLVYYGVDMKVEMDVSLKRLDGDSLARAFIKTYLGILESKEPESSFDASVQTQKYKEKYPVIRRLFASGFLRSSFLRTRIDPLFKGENPPIELVIRAAMIGHSRFAKEITGIKTLLLEFDLSDHVCSKSSVHLPEDVANIIVEYWFGYV